MSETTRGKLLEDILAATTQMANRLEAENEGLRRALKIIEWPPIYDPWAEKNTVFYCHACGNHKEIGHARNCVVGNALAKESEADDAND